MVLATSAVSPGSSPLLLRMGGMGKGRASPQRASDISVGVRCEILTRTVCQGAFLTLHLSSGYPSILEEVVYGYGVFRHTPVHWPQIWCAEQSWNFAGQETNSRYFRLVLPTDSKLLGVKAGMTSCKGVHAFAGFLFVSSITRTGSLFMAPANHSPPNAVLRETMRKSDFETPSKLQQGSLSCTHFFWECGGFAPSVQAVVASSSLKQVRGMRAPGEPSPCRLHMSRRSPTSPVIW